MVYFHFVNQAFLPLQPTEHFKHCFCVEFIVSIILYFLNLFLIVYFPVNMEESVVEFFLFIWREGSRLQWGNSLIWLISTWVKGEVHSNLPTKLSFVYLFITGDKFVPFWKHHMFVVRIQVGARDMTVRYELWIKICSYIYRMFTK